VIFYKTFRQNFPHLIKMDLSQKMKQKSFENNFPYLFLKPMSSFESHITVEPQDAGTLQQFCSTFGLKYICCQNSSGEFPCQCMITQKATGVTPEQMIEKALDLKDAVTKFGCRVVRTKVEEMLSISANSSRVVQGDQYFEAHFKVSVSSAQIKSLENSMINLQVYFSKNVTKYPTASMPSEQLLTIRMKNVSCEMFYLKIKKVRDILQALNLTCVVHRECSIYDDNPALDIGWCE
jgi:hypothetical protein